MLGQEVVLPLEMQRLLAFVCPTEPHVQYVRRTLLVAEVCDTSPPVGGLVAMARAGWGIVDLVRVER